MKVSAVGFLFQNSLKKSPLKGKNYTCIIHKADGEGNFIRNLTSSPIIKTNKSDTVTLKEAKSDILKAFNSISKKKSDNKFIGAAIKDGNKETEIHSLISDRLFAVRTKDEAGKNHFRILNQKHTKDVIAKNLYLEA